MDQGHNVGKLLGELNLKFSKIFPVQPQKLVIEATFIAYLDL